MVNSVCTGKTYYLLSVVAVFYWRVFLYLIVLRVHAIFPQPINDPNTLRDKRMNSLVSYAKKVEDEMYRTASSRVSCFFHLLFYRISVIWCWFAHNEVCITMWCLYVALYINLVFEKQY